MKVWIVIDRADEAAKENGESVEDEIFFIVYKRLASAQKACREHLKQVWGADFEDEIDWGETVTEGKLRKFLGMPKADVEGYFELYEVEVK